MNVILNKYLEILENAIRTNPNPTLILAARYLMSEFDREDIPDWIAVLAGGYVDSWDAVLEETLIEMEMDDDTEQN